MYKYNYVTIISDIINIIKETKASIDGSNNKKQTVANYFRNSFRLVFIGLFFGIATLYGYLQHNAFSHYNKYLMLGIFAVCFLVPIIALISILVMLVMYRGKHSVFTVDENIVCYNDAKISWDSILDVYTSKNCLFIVRNTSGPTLDIGIPKRIFESEEEFNEVYEYIKSRITK